MSIQNYPCGDCPDCIAIGDGEGLCDYTDSEFIVDLYEMHPHCPKPEGPKNDTDT